MHEIHEREVVGTKDLSSFPVQTLNRDVFGDTVVLEHLAQERHCCAQMPRRWDLHVKLPRA